MNNRKLCFDFDNEWVLERSGNGVRLVKPNKLNSHKIQLSEFMQSPMNIYFVDNNSIVQNLNDKTAETCGYLSKKNAIGKSLRNVSKGETAHIIIKNDRDIIKTKSFKIIDETYIRSDNQEMSAISIKFPWFDNHKTIGIFGCSILTGENGDNIAESFTFLVSSGLLLPHTPANSMMPGLNIGNVYFDKRDADILYYLVRGNTAKSIAKILKLSNRTIEHRLEKIKIKLNVESKSSLIEKIFDQISLKIGDPGL